MKPVYSELRSENFGEFSRGDFIEILTVWAESLPDTLAELRSALLGKDVATVLRGLHNLKSNTTYICCSDLPQQVREVELAVKADAAQLHGVEPLIQRCEILLKEISMFLE